MSEDLENIKCFRQACACLLGDLYQVFPRKLTIETRRYQRQAVQDLRISEECEVQEDGDDILINCSIRFLIAEGFIRLDQATYQKEETNMELQGLCLTAKGIAVLSQDASGEEGNFTKTIGTSLVESESEAIIQNTVAAIFKAEL